MPTYDYRCNECGHELELFQSIKAAVKRRCPECGRNTLKRLIGTGSGVIFKGSGFYQTDYRSEGYRKAAESDKKATEGNKSSAEGAEKKKESAEKKESKGKNQSKGTKGSTSDGT